MNLDSKVYIAGHRGLAGSAIMRELQRQGYTNLVTRTHAELDLEDAAATQRFFEQERPDLVFLAAAKVGGIHANNTYPVEFLMSNLLIEANICRAAYATKVNRLIFLGSSCIYPRDCPQPIKEKYLLTGPLEATNRPYALAKIAGIEMCWSYNREYGTKWLAAMPTNLYGPGDNYDLNNSHVLPALIRKLHLAKLAHQGDYAGIARDEATHGPIPADLKSSLLEPNSNLAHHCEKAVSCEQSVAERDTSPEGAGRHSVAVPRSSRDWPQANKAIQKASGSPRSVRDDEADPLASCPLPLVPVVTLWGSGTPRREFLYVDDLANALVFLATLDDARYDALVDPSYCPLINVGSGEDLTIRELAETIAEVVGYHGKFVQDTSKPDGTMRKIMDVSRINALGWQRKISLKEGIALSYQDMLSKIVLPIVPRPLPLEP